MTLRRWIALAAVFVLGLLLGGLLLGGRGGSGDASHEGHAEVAETGGATVWTCSMHPQFKLPEPGKCPICFMDLIPLEEDSGSGSPTQLAMSEAAMKLAEVRTEPVRREFVEAAIRTVGKVAVDERLLRRITAWVPGRLDRLYVDYTGIPVSAGDHLVDLYSPQLYSAQTELIQAKRALDGLGPGAGTTIREGAEATLRAAGEKLRLLGLKPYQIEEVLTRGEPREHVTIYAPAGGIVVHKNAVEGEYVQTGSPIYTIADLSRVWVLLDVYESDLVWVHYGQNVRFEVEAYPGEIFEGRVAFIQPTVDPKTRTVKVRLNVLNPRDRLKPDMFVRATIRTRVLGDGRTLAPDLAGKWISPMHPEVVKDRPGSCDVCGMDLVRAEELGFATSAGDEEPPLIIPASAPLITGERAVVYVRVPGTERPTFEGREILLGPKAGGSYVVEEGLREGELVVVEGNFKIDSAMQIQARPSMMSAKAPTPAPPSAGSEGPEASEAGLRGAGETLRAAAAGAWPGYFALHGALAGDDADATRRAAADLARILDGIALDGLSGEALRAASDWRSGARRAAEEVRAARDLAEARVRFETLSERFIRLDRTVGPPPGEEHHLVFCPMAFDNAGAYWLQDGTGVLNPYYGASMLKCGAVKETFGAGSPE